MNLQILNSPEVNSIIDRIGFAHTKDGIYTLDATILEYLNIEVDLIPEHRPVSLHIVPYTIVEEEIIFYAFESPKEPTVYVSFPIVHKDFVANPASGEEVMSLCKTMIAKVIRTLSQPEIDIKFDFSTFQFPAVLKGEFVWAFELRGDSDHAVDEMVGRLGAVLGRVTVGQATDGDIPLDAFSIEIASYKAPKSDLTV